MEDIAHKVIKGHLSKLKLFKKVERILNHEMITDILTNLQEDS